MGNRMMSSPRNLAAASVNERNRVARAQFLSRMRESALLPQFFPNPDPISAERCVPSPGARDVERILGAMATIVDALNPVRNRASVAHPNDELLDVSSAAQSVSMVKAALDFLPRILPLLCLL